MSGDSPDSRPATDGGSASDAGVPEADSRPAPSEQPGPEERDHPEGRRNLEGIRIDPVLEAEHESRRAVISALVEDEPGVLARVSGLVSRRQFNIESLTVGPTTVDGHSRITMVVEETDPGIDQIEKQMAKLKPVISVGEVSGNAVTAELVLLKVEADDPAAVHAVTEMYDGRTLDAGPRTITVQLTGDEARIDDALDAFRQFGIIEIARTGQTALARGDVPTAPGEKPGTAGEPTTHDS
ncbi:acetolactate synthase small subunit [Halorubrum depositum]|uniref:acetolactate synthase small subunit n=1 Tax=Halorubrum depositum TaxID=2583992 RepID=UPI0011A5BF27|nr:acetolactate synthase small subunit [Halorubrum depositum]